MAAFDDGIYTLINERLVLHIPGIDPPTLSLECSQPSRQSVTRVLEAAPTLPEPLRDKDFRDIGPRPPMTSRKVASQALAESLRAGLTGLRTLC
jgi:hypothetical protein